MISLEDAQQLVVTHAAPMGAESAPLSRCLHRVLAEDVFSDVDVPPFDKSAVDGYACRREDLPGPLRLIESVPAGCVPTRTIVQSTCARVMTGAPLPSGTDCVVMLEHTREDTEGHIHHNGAEVRPNLCRKAEDLAIGTCTLARGACIGPAEIAVLATVGRACPIVAQQPRIALLATGTELVPVEATPQGGQIRNSNSHQLLALLAHIGLEASDLGTVPDDLESQTRAVSTALATHDVVLSTGGVSVGDFDLIPAIIAALGMTIHIRKVAMQPGKPVVFATQGTKSYFGLSGNPLSSLVQFEMLVRPHLAARQGGQWHPKVLHLPLAETLHRKTVDRPAFVPVRLTQNGVVPVPFHGSAHIAALTQADALVRFPQGIADLQSGAMAEAYLLPG